jgi:hypothetical protein
VTEDDSEQTLVTSAHHHAGTKEAGTKPPLVALAKPVELAAMQPRA